jgi:F-type H+-transporting ATPase subunit b
MHIDCFTVATQAINFLVLMWLLKRFLYKPILNAIAAREKNIAYQLADAKAKEAAAQKEQVDFKQKNDAFDQQKEQLLSDAKKKAAMAQEALMKCAKEKADAYSVKRKAAWEQEEQKLGDALIQRSKQEIYAITAKVLYDLAGVSLEESMVDAFLKHLAALSKADKQTVVSGMETYAAGTVVTSAFDLNSAQQKAIKAVLKEQLGTDIHTLTFKTVPDLVCGIELAVSGHKLAWSVGDYLSRLEKTVDTAMEKQAKPVKESTHAA